MVNRTNVKPQPPQHIHLFLWVFFILFLFCLSAFKSSCFIFLSHRLTALFALLLWLRKNNTFRRLTMSEMCVCVHARTCTGMSVCVYPCVCVCGSRELGVHPSPVALTVSCSGRGLSLRNACCHLSSITTCCCPILPALYCLGFVLDKSRKAPRFMGQGWV